MSSETLKPSSNTTGAFQEVYDNWDLLEKIAITIIKNKEVNISNGRALEIVNDFRNFVEAYPVLLKSVRIKGYLSRTKTNDVLHDYSRMMRTKFKLSALSCVPTNAELECSCAGYVKCPIKLFYSTQTVYVIYNMFSSFGSLVIKKIIEGYDKFVVCLDELLESKHYFNYGKLVSVKRLKYGKLIRTMMILESSDRNYTGFLTLTIKIFLIELRKDLVKINVNGFDCEKIVRRIIKSFNWTLDCNHLDYNR